MISILAQVAADFEPSGVDELQIDRLADIIKNLEDLNAQIHQIWLTVVFVGTFIVGDLIFRYFFRRRVDD